MASVASDSPLFPTARTLPASRGAASQDMSPGAETGEFAKLLDGNAANEAPSRARHDRGDDSTSTKGNRRNNDPVNSKRSSDRAPATDAAPGSEPAAQPDAVKDASRETPADSSAPTDDQAQQDTSAESTATDSEPVAAMQTTPDIAVPITTFAMVTPAALISEIAVAAPAAIPDTVPVAPAATPETNSPDVAPAAAAPAAAVPGEAVPGAGAPRPAETPELAAQPVAPQLKLKQAADAAKTDISTDKPGSLASGVSHQDGEQAIIDGANEQRDAGAPERAPANAEAATKQTARPHEGPAAPKSGAELAQNSGAAAPVHNVLPAQSTAAASAAAAASPAQAPAATVPVAGLAVEIAAQSNAGRSRFEIRLDPPELGRIDVRLEIDNEGHVKSRLIVERAETLDMLRRDAPQLERALQQAGLKTADNALEFSLRQDTPHHDDEARQNAGRLVVPDDGAVALDTVQHNYGRLLGLGGGLDIRV